MLNILGALWALILDTSQWQGLLTFTKLADSWIFGYWFGRHRIIILKATEGNGYTDPCYVENARRAALAGFVHLAYHYARPDRNPNDAAAEAAFVARVAQANGARAIMLDFEEGSLTAAELAAWRHTFLTTLFALWDAPHGLYEGAYLIGTDRKPIPVDGELAGRVWICVPNYPTTAADPDPTKFTHLPPLPPGFTKLALWQYTSNAHVPGIGGTSVDCSIATADWVALIEGDPQPQEEDMPSTDDLLEALAADTDLAKAARLKIAQSCTADFVQLMTGPYPQGSEVRSGIAAAVVAAEAAKASPGDPAAIASAIAGYLGPDLAKEVLDELGKRLAS